VNRHISLRALAIIILLVAGIAPAETPNRVTILYDSFGKSPSLSMDWGFAALVEYGGKRIISLFGGLHQIQKNDTEVERIAAALRDQYKLERVAPGQCTGEPEFAALKRVFGDHYVYAGVGPVVDLPAATSTRTASTGP
jgi:metal-dependent hydrolase (beta-lactamase superfamily II)